jgi:hypothetical protein
MRNKKSLLIFFSIIFSIIFSSQLLYLLFLNISNNHLLNIPSWNTTNSSFYFSDMKVIFSWARRAYENFSIFQIGSNISEITNKYHYFSSRGLGYYIYGFLLNIFQTPILIITLNYVFFSFLNFYLVCCYFKEYKSINIIFLAILSILFGSKIFGGVLNPFHYYEYFKREMYDINTYFLNFYTQLYRIPNILINNIFIFLNFYLIKRFFLRPSNIFFLIVALFLLMSSFIDPLIFIIYIAFLFFIVLFHKYKNNISTNIFYFFLLIIFLLSLTLIFHFYNFNYVIKSGTERHGIGLPNFWVGNYIFSYEMLFFPILLFLIFFKNLRKFFLFDFYFLILTLSIYIAAHFFIGSFFAGRITHRNFEILIACISYSIIFKIFSDKLIIKKLKVFLIFFILHLVYVFLQTKSQFFFYYLCFLFFISFFLYLFFLIKNKNYRVYLINFFMIFLIIYFFISLYKKNITEKYTIEKSEIEQMNFFNWSTNISKMTVISLDLGFILNNELQTNNNVYISSILNSPALMTRADVIKRMNDIFYLYGFSKPDLSEYLKDYNSLDELNKEPFNYEKNNIALINEIIFYENYQVNYNKHIPINILLNEYEDYLKEKRYNNISYFDTCVITKYDSKFIKDKSFFSSLNNEKPIYKNSFLSAYHCKLKIN